MTSGLPDISKLHAPTARFAALLVMLLGFFALLPSEAEAQTCSFTITDIDFGNVANTQVDVTGTLTANCSGWSGIATNVMVCPNIGSGSGGVTTGVLRRVASGTNRMNYQLYSNSGRTAVWGSWYWASAPRPPKLSVSTAVAGAGSGSWTIYGRFIAGQGASPLGTYTSSFGAGQVDIRYAADPSGLTPCSGSIGTAGLPQPSFNVRARRGAACIFSTSSIDFGLRATLSAVINAQSTISVNCTGPYEISLSNGGTGTGPTNRKMVKGAESVTYGLYSGTFILTPWGTAAGQTVSGTGTGTVQYYTVQGRVPIQATPSAGEYTDTVVATLTY